MANGCNRGGALSSHFSRSLHIAQATIAEGENAHIHCSYMNILLTYQTVIS